MNNQQRFQKMEKAIRLSRYHAVVEVEEHGIPDRVTLLMKSGAPSRISVFFYSELATLSTACLAEQINAMGDATLDIIEQNPAIHFSPFTEEQRLELLRETYQA